MIKEAGTCGIALVSQHCLVQFYVTSHIVFVLFTWQCTGFCFMTSYGGLIKNLVFKQLFTELMQLLLFSLTQPPTQAFPFCILLGQQLINQLLGGDNYSCDMSNYMQFVCYQIDILGCKTKSKHFYTKHFLVLRYLDTS